MRLLARFHLLLLLIAGSVVFSTLEAFAVDRTTPYTVLAGNAGLGTMHYNVQILAGASGFAVSGGSATLSAMTTDNEDVVIPFDQVFDASLTQNVTIAPFMWAASNGGVWRAGATLYVEDIGPAAGPA